MSSSEPLPKCLATSYFIPGMGQDGWSYIRIIGGETLKSGRPISFGWLPRCFWLSPPLGGPDPTIRRTGGRNPCSGMALLLLFAPVVLEAALLFVDITPGLFAIVVVSTALCVGGGRQRGLVKPSRTCPISALFARTSEGREQALIAARVLNYEEIAGCPPARTGAPVRRPDRVTPSRRRSRPHALPGRRRNFRLVRGAAAAFRQPLDALYTLFRNPARVNGLSLDLSVSFGVGDRQRPLAHQSPRQRARRGRGSGPRRPEVEILRSGEPRGRFVETFDAQSARHAIDRGEVWVAYQPKLDLQSRRIIGAEALARWTHPEKGPIAASEFIAAAEQHDRIGKLTDFVLENAISAAAAVNRKRPRLRNRGQLVGPLAERQGAGPAPPRHARAA